MKEKKKLFLSPSSSEVAKDESEEAEGNVISDDVLVISLGIVNECPGMLSEQKVHISG